MTLVQLYMLFNVELDGHVVMDGEYMRIFKNELVCLNAISSDWEKSQKLFVKVMQSR
jgi:hypothetical protein